MEEIRFFDAACGVGSTSLRPLPGIAELLAEMDRNGVERALVFHNDTGVLGAEVANRKLPQMLEAEDPGRRLDAVWAVLPEECGELAAPDAFFSEMKNSRARAITLDPFNHRYVACRLSIGEYMDEAIRRKTVVLLNSFAGKWDDLYAFMKEFPELHCIIHGGDKWGNDRYIRPLLKAFPNLCVELSGYWVPEGIADLAKKYGANRLLYGSGFPRYNHGSGMLQIKQSGLDLDDIALIAGKNLEDMLEESSC